MRSQLALATLGSLLGLYGCISKGDTVIGDTDRRVTKPTEDGGKIDSKPSVTDEHASGVSDSDTSEDSANAATDQSPPASTTADTTNESDVPGPVTEPSATEDGVASDETSAAVSSGDTSSDEPTVETAPSEEPESNDKCVPQEPLALTKNSSAKRGLTAVMGGDVILATWQGMPAGTVKAQYVLANADLEPLSDGPQSVDDVNGADTVTGYMAAAYSPNSEQFMISWVNFPGDGAYPKVQLIDSAGALVDLPIAMGSFMNHLALGRHRMAWRDGRFIFDYYWCASGGSGCPGVPEGAPFNPSGWFLIDDETGVITHPANEGSPNPGAHAGTQVLQLLPFAEAESELEGFLGLYLGSPLGITQYRLDGSYGGSNLPRPAETGEPPAEQGNGNADSKFAWDGEKAIVFTQGVGIGRSGGEGAALRQERWDLAGNLEYTKKLTTKALQPFGTHVKGDTVSLLAGNNAALYFIQSNRKGTVLLEPEIIASGKDIRNATLLVDDVGPLVVYLDTIDGTDQVMAARIDCTP